MSSKLQMHASLNSMSSSLRTIQVEGVDSPPLVVVSETDARLEAVQLTESSQVYWGAVTGDLITLKPGDVVLDVGANVGSFSRLAARVVGHTGAVYAVEPLPQVFEALKQNCELTRQWYNHSPTEHAPAPIHPVHAGVVPSTGANGAAQFVYFPKQVQEKCTALSTQAEHRDDADAIAATASIVMYGQAKAVSLLQQVARGLARLAPWLYKPIHQVVFRWLMLSGDTLVVCPTITLDQLLDQHNLTRVDLLKINVERGELGVLQSLDAGHWLRIQQVSMQLHDRGTTLDQALDILKRMAGFSNIKVYKEPRFQGCCLVQVYASRAAA